MVNDRREKNVPGAGEEDSVYYLTDERGKEYPFELLDVIDYMGGKYAVFFPLDEGQDDAEDSEAVILEAFPQADGTLEFDGVDDEDVIDDVFALFMKHMRAAFDAETGN